MTQLIRRVVGLASAVALLPALAHGQTLAGTFLELQPIVTIRDIVTVTDTAGAKTTGRVRELTPDFADGPRGDSAPASRRIPTATPARAGLSVCVSW